MGSFAEEPDVEVAEQQTEAVGVVHRAVQAAVPVHAQVVGQVRGQTQALLPESVRVDLCQLAQRAAVGAAHFDCAGVGQKGANGGFASLYVRPEQGKGVTVAALAERRNVVPTQTRRCSFYFVFHSIKPIFHAA